MATPTNPSPTPSPTPSPAHHSHRNTTSDTGTGGTNIPQKSRRSSTACGVSSPWTQIVRSGESESTVASTSSSPPPPPPASCEQIVHSSDYSPPEEVVVSLLSPGDSATEAQLESSDNGSGHGSNSNVAKRAAWNKPSNGAADVSPVMGAVSWPALSVSTKASPKSPSSDSLKALSDGSVSVSQVMGMTSASHKQANTDNVNLNTMLNHVVPSRQRSMERGGGNSNHNASANGGFSQQQAQGFEVEIVLNNSGKSGNSGAESSSRDNSHRDGFQWGGFGSQTHGGNDYQHQQNSNRRGNVAPHPRGDGTYHHGYGGRRVQERRNQDWKPHRGLGNRDAHMQPQRIPARPFMGRSPHTSPPFIPTPMPVQPYRTPMVYSEVPPVFYILGPFPDSLRMPTLSPVPPVFQIPDTQLHTRIVNQIDYYFSNENLIKDTFLRQNMDEHGWVPVTLIAGFKKVMELTDNNIQLILNAVRSSTVVEVQDEKLRRRDDWFHWLMPPSVQNSTVSSPQSLKMSSPDLLVENLQRVAFDDKTIRHGNAEAHFTRSSSAELSTPPSKQFGNEMAAQARAQHSQPMVVGNPS